MVWNALECPFWLGFCLEKLNSRGAKVQFNIILVSNVVELGNFNIIYRSLSLHQRWDTLEDPMLEVERLISTWYLIQRCWNQDILSEFSGGCLSVQGFMEWRVKFWSSSGAFQYQYCGMRSELDLQVCGSVHTLILGRVWWGIPNLNLAATTNSGPVGEV